MTYSPDRLQKIALSLMGGLVVITFLLANVQALVWQSSDWLVGAVLPATVVELTNEERVDYSSRPLQRSATLDAAAKMKAEHMARNGYFAHYAPDGTSPWFWFDQAGYTYAHAGENLAIHFSDSDEVVEAWMDSPLHKANIIDSKFTEIGVGTAKGKYNGDSTVYVVQLFGTPAYIPPAPATPAPTVPAQEVVVEQASEAVAIADVEPESLQVPASEASESPLVPIAAGEAVASASETQSAEGASNAVEETTVPDESDVSNTVQVAAEEVITFTPVPEPSAAELAQVREVVPEVEFIIGETAPSLMTISSGLAAANAVPEIESPTIETSFLSLATQPNTVLQVMYTLIALAVFVLLILSFVNELKHAHPVQMSYSVAMLLIMVSLYWLHTSLTEGAIVV